MVYSYTIAIRNAIPPIVITSHASKTFEVQGLGSPKNIKLPYTKVAWVL